MSNPKPARPKIKSASTALKLTPEEAKKVLLRFNAKLDRVAGYSFFNFKRYSVAWNFRADGQSTTEQTLPTSEQIDAVLLNLRFFFVNNEATAFWNLKTAYDALQIPAILCSEVDTAYADWEQWKNETSLIGGYSNFDLFRVIAYGEIVHQNQEKWVEVYEKWIQHEALAGFAMSDFCSCLISIFNFAARFEGINKRILALP